MDANGARELTKRLEAQAHWRQATAVQTGEQPTSDPDAQDLDELGEGVRRYGIETQRMIVEGRPALVTHRLCKRLREGRWEVTLDVESIDYLEDNVGS
jgi:N-acetyl-anhydromuramyl-L-alanine amidase AmpD